VCVCVCVCVLCVCVCVCVFAEDEACVQVSRSLSYVSFHICWSIFKCVLLLNF